MTKKLGFCIRTCLVLAIVVGAGIYCLPDPTSLKTAVFAVATAVIITAMIVMILGVKERWGVLPGLDFHRDIQLALSTPQSSAEVIQGFLIFLGLLIIAIFKAS